MYVVKSALKSLWIQSVNFGKNPFVLYPRLVVFITVAFMCMAFTTGTQSDGAAASIDDLKLNQIQVVTSHNSYKLATEPAVLRFLKFLYAFRVLPKEFNPAYIDYAHDPLTVQLTKYQVHGLELDVYNDPTGGRYYHRQGRAFAWKRTASRIEELKKPGFKMLHIADFDYNTTNYTFVSALKELKTWSDAHPDHLPLFINVEVKVTAPAEMIPFPRLAKSARFDSTAADALDAEVKSVFGNDLQGIITPDQVRGNYATLEQAVLAGNWPLLKASRGKIVFSIDAEGYAGGVYKKGHPSLKSRAMFVYSEPGTPEAAFVMLNEPDTLFNKIRDCVAKGYIVEPQCDEATMQARRGDYSRMNAAFNSGAQILATDYYRPDARAPKHGFTNYQVMLPGNKMARIDSLIAPDKLGVDIGK